MKECQQELTKNEWSEIIGALQYYRENTEDENKTALIAEKKAIFQYSNYENLHQKHEAKNYGGK